MQNISMEAHSPKLLTDSEHEYKYEEVVGSLAQADERQQGLKNILFSEKGRASAATISHAIANVHQSELEKFESGEVTEEMFNPPTDSTVRILGGFNQVQQEHLNTYWQASLMRLENMRQMARDGVASGAPFGLLTPEFKPRINIESRDGRNLYSIMAESFPEYKQGILKVVFGIRDADVTIGLAKNESHWTWIESNEAMPWYAPYKEILKDPKGWLDGQADKTNTNRRRAIRHAHNQLIDIEHGNNILYQFLHSPDKFAEEILKGSRIPERLMSHHEYDRLGLAFDRLPKDVAAIIPDQDSLYLAASNHLAIDRYRHPIDKEGQIYWDATIFPIEVQNSSGRSIGITTAEKRTDEIGTRGLYSGFSILHNIALWENTGKQTKSLA